MASIPEMGEYLVGSYLKIVEGCEVADYNVRSPQGGMKSLNELDVVGYNFEEDRAILCEVSTHMAGLYARSRDDLRVKTEKH